MMPDGRNRRETLDLLNLNSTNSSRMDVHICPLLARTVIFIHDKCTEHCREYDCPLVQTEGTQPNQ